MPTTTIAVNQDVLAAKKQRAKEQRQLFTTQGTFVINLVSSPGAGKTSLLQATARYWQNRFRVGVLVGDLATDRDVMQFGSRRICWFDHKRTDRGLFAKPLGQHSVLKTCFHSSRGKV